MGLIYYVSTDGSDSNNGLSVNQAFQTITHAINIATNEGSFGNKIWIAPGIYYETVYNDYRVYNDLSIEGDSSGIIFGVPKDAINVGEIYFYFGEATHSIVRLKNIMTGSIAIIAETQYMENPLETCDLYLTNFALGGNFGISTWCSLIAVNCTFYGSCDCITGTFYNCIANAGFWVGETLLHSCFSPYIYPAEGYTIDNITVQNHIYNSAQFSNIEGREYLLAEGSPGIDSGMIIEGYSPDIYGNVRPQGIAPDRGVAESIANPTMTIVQCVAISFYHVEVI